MATTYKQKLIGEINAVPENLLPRFYRIMHILRTELTRQGNGQLRDCSVGYGCAPNGEQHRSRSGNA